MKKVLKIILVIIMLLGIACSISNFVPIETKAGGGGGGGLMGIVDPETGKCVDKGNECKILIY